MSSSEITASVHTMSIFGNQSLFGAQPSALTTSGTTTQSGLNLPNAGSVFGGFGFGATSATQNTGLFQPATSKPAGSLFPNFSTNVSQQTSSVFPTFSTASQPGGLFAPQNSVGLGSTFKPSQPAMGSLFQPLGVQPFGGAVTTQSVQQQPTQQTSVDAFFTSLCQPLLFNDERDKIVARWNQLQVMWGTGIGYCSLGVASYTPENTFARFKAIAYNLLPTSTDEDGLVCLYLSRPFSEVLPQRQGVQDTLFRLLGGRPTLNMVVEEIRPCAEQENYTEVIFKVMERQATGNLTNVSSSELTRYLSSPTIASQLQSQLCACKLSSEVRPSSNQLTAYFENPPAGIDRLVWQQAQMDNPHPDRMIPVPLIGFAELKRRKQDQVAFSQQQSAILKQIGEIVHQMKTGQLTISQKVTQLKRKQIEISHRILNVLRRQEVHRRAGFAIRVEEESLRCGLERIWSEITSPRGLRVRFQDARAALNANADNMSVAEKENAAGLGTGNRVTADPHYNWNLDADSLAELKEYLSQRQNGIRELQHLITEMSSTLRIIEDGPTSTPTGNKFALKPLSRATPSKVSFALNTRLR
ncbi:Nuclear pore complex protein Nup54 [Fasciola hepatica]|uniref:Nuclear pore complex protein Nup54 n=1 Tax=Fasciola hepatica TaxID=6192 RepID=A0A4E0RUV5_FASHE|nr:Nuclear pore complex protein Nup54 [Fasciola hepatica]